MNKSQQLYKLLLKIPKGKVTTYKNLADKLNTSPRAIGRMLNCNKYPEKYPCFKVIMNNGKLGGYSNGVKKKIQLLRKNGIKAKNMKITNKKLVYMFHI